MGRHRRRRGQERLQHIHIARRRRHTDLRPLAQAQRKLQLVPSLLPALPFRQFIHPSRIKLRPPQPFGIMRRMHRGNRPIGPNQPLARRLPIGPPIRWATGQYPAVAKNHHLAHLLNGLPHQRHAATRPRIQRTAPLNLATHPFRPGAGLARTAPAHDHPCPPIPLRRQLMVQGPELEQKRESQKLSLI